MSQMTTRKSSVTSTMTSTFQSNLGQDPGQFGRSLNTLLIVPSLSMTQYVSVVRSLVYDFKDLNEFHEIQRMNK